MHFHRLLLLLAGTCALSQAQVYSPKVMKVGQPDASDLKRLAQGIYAQAHAATPREKAEAVWRFFLTDGRFVKPGFWYHIAGWTYEEPLGEVLDPIKLLNSYGFGLCYHIAPLLSAVYDAGGFEDSRVWFLTGHTVAEVFYEGAYHYFDSDMMGYNPVGSGPLKSRPVASVHDIEKDGSIILGKLVGPQRADVTGVDQPWYPADVRAHAIGGLAELFTTQNNNWLYPFKRYPQGHSMDFTLRPGEKMIRYFHPETDRSYYLPYRYDGSTRVEFPREISEYQIRTNDGPRSQKDARLWATGRLEYRPPLDRNPTLVFSMPSPYVVMDAQFQLVVDLPDQGSRLEVETSVDSGHTWSKGTALEGPFQGTWTAVPAIGKESEHGKLSAVSGSYGYLARFLRSGAASIRSLVLTTRFQLNPRTLPELTPGRNEIEVQTAPRQRTEVVVQADRLEAFAAKVTNAVFLADQGQGFVINRGDHPGEIIFALEESDGDLSGFDAGGRFLDLRAGLAPDKLTAEVRSVASWPAEQAPDPSASIAWARSISGPYQTVWTYNPRIDWRDGQPIERTLRWPEVDRSVDHLPPGTHKVYVRYQLNGMAIDSFRLATVRPAPASSPFLITHVWSENGLGRTRTIKLDRASNSTRYAIDIAPSNKITNEAVILECPLRARHRTPRP